jgi:hypothetical protein
MDTGSFFFSFESDLLGNPLRLLSGGAPEVGDQASKKTLADPVSIVQNESCLLFNDSSWRYSRSGRDWPDMWGYRTLAFLPLRTDNRAGGAFVVPVSEFPVRPPLGVLPAPNQHTVRTGQYQSFLDVVVGQRDHSASALQKSTVSKYHLFQEVPKANAPGRPRCLPGHSAFCCPAVGRGLTL